MTFHVSNPTGFSAIIKFDARSGSWSARHDEKNVGLPSFEAVVNLDTMATGWFALVAGEPPREVLDERDGPAPKPTGPIEFKRGIKFELYGSTNLPELNGAALEHRVFVSTAIGPIRAIEGLYQDCHRPRKDHPGLSPVVRFDGATPIVLRLGTSYRPSLKVVGWTAWPLEQSEDEKSPTSDWDADDDLDL